MNTEGKFKASATYLKLDTTQHGDIATITSEGSETEMKSKFTGEMEWKLNLDVEINGKKLIFTPWNKEGVQLQDAFGFDTAKWIGRRIQILHVNGKMIIVPNRHPEPKTQ